MRIGIRAALAALALTALATPALSTPSWARPASLAEPSTPIDYVSLGDSYTAGPLVPPRATNGDAICYRSAGNYPTTLASMLQTATFRDVSCSGARSIDLRRRQHVFAGIRPAAQVAALSAETDLVTLGMGGNDFGLFGSMTSKCQELRSQDPTGSPCRAYYTRTIRGRTVDTKARDARRIQAHLERAVQEIRAAAPDAAVYLVGYPQILPATGTCDAVPFATGDYVWGHHVEWLLNRSVRQAAQAQGATYVNLAKPSVGHDACAGDQAWVNGSVTDFNRAYAFHPFRAGMDAAAAIAYRTITGTDAPTAP